MRACLSIMIFTTLASESSGITRPAWRSKRSARWRKAISRDRHRGDHQRDVGAGALPGDAEAEGYRVVKDAGPAKSPRDRALLPRRVAADPLGCHGSLQQGGWNCEPVALPDEFGKWGSVYPQFLRSSRAGLWDLLLAALANSQAASTSRTIPKRSKRYLSPGAFENRVTAQGRLHRSLQNLALLQNFATLHVPIG